MQPLDPLHLPLCGMQLIEASAGTGKTWTLAALYVRLVLGHKPSQQRLDAGLFPPQILVMTFTDAATAELRDRIRQRLVQAAAFFKAHANAGQAATPDGFLQAIANNIDPDQYPLAAQRLDWAAQWMDEAAIYTIHGWCKRMLQTHAFDSHSLFNLALNETTDQLRLQAVQDYWRKWYYPLPLAQLHPVLKIAATPQELLKVLQSQWSLLQKTPESWLEPKADADLQVELDRWSAWQQQQSALFNQLIETSEMALPALQTAIDNKHIKGNQKHWQSRWQLWSLAMQNATSAQTQALPDKVTQYLSINALVKSWPAASQYPAFEIIQAMADHAQTEPAIDQHLLQHATYTVAKQYQLLKHEHGQLEFNDLLQQLYQAVHRPNSTLANTIAQQFPTALVDEFQDTDPWQYGALQHIYAQRADSTGLIMIGDPKQAIYSFRGADLPTYLQARTQAQGIYSLAVNHRSTPEVVGAVNHLFTQATHPFGSIDFAPVQASNHAPKAFVHAGHVVPAMNLWCMPYDNHAACVTNNVYLKYMAKACANHIAQLLQAKSAQAQDMAVLVRSQSQAKLIQQALSRQGVRSVYLSDRSNVYLSPEAIELWRLLRAVLSPNETQWVRASLSSSIWGLSTAELEQQLQSEDPWDACIDQFHQWRHIWLQQGPLSMIRHWMHDCGIGQRLFEPTGNQDAGAERKITNWLHLGELLQTASLQLQGPQALLRHCENQIRLAQSGQLADNTETQQRLESEGQLVRIVTLHKSKGLQYPLVWLPFVSSFQSKAFQGITAAQQQAMLDEDMRLLYVGLTRAQQAMWLGIAPIKGDMTGDNPSPRTAWSVLINRQTGADLYTRMQQQLPHPHICQCPPDLSHDDWAVPDQTSETSNQRMVPLEPSRQLTPRWWTASFSALTNSLQNNADAWAHQPETTVGNAFQAPATAVLQAFAAGSRYGTFLHDLLERQAHRQWQPLPIESHPGAANHSNQPWWTDQAHRLGIAPDQHLPLAQWVNAIMMQPIALPRAAKPIVLSQLQSQHFAAEMGFTLPVGQLAASKLDQIIQHHIWPGQARAPLQDSLLHGMLTGFIDLVVQHEEVYYVLDYKSNRLPQYTAEHMQQAMLAHRYDVQCALYMLALHRLLRSRLPAYDPTIHLGHGMYWFIRGVHEPQAGALHCLVPLDLILELDHLITPQP